MHAVAHELTGYHLEELVSERPSTATYRARRRSDGCLVALKILRGESHQAAARFDVEIRAHERLVHPSIPALVAHGQNADAIWFATTWVEGRTLEQAVADGDLGFEEVVRTIVEIAGALQVAHEAGVVHRDVKPSNIIVRPNAPAVLLDFGIAKLEDINITVVGKTNGTPIYMAPEQITGQPVDRRADVFALAVVLYEALSGQLPWPVSDQVYTLLAAKCQSMPAPFSNAILTSERPRLRHDVVEALHQTLHRALQPDPDERCPSADELAVDLVRVLRLSETEPVLNGQRTRRPAPRAPSKPPIRQVGPRRIVERKPVSEGPKATKPTPARKARWATLLLGATLIATASAAALLAF